jgi:ATP-dependent DNA ligase
VPKCVPRARPARCFAIEPYNCKSVARAASAHAASKGDLVFQHACKMGFEGIISKRLGSIYRSGRSKDWLKFKNPDAPAVKREAEEDWGKGKWRWPTSG